MEFEEQEVEMGIPETQPAAASIGNSEKLGSGPEGAAASAIGRKGTTAARYRECQKNHAVSFGGHAVDGCCEFMAAGEDGSMEAVICAACSCHRNFHRKEIDGGAEISPYHHQHQHHHRPPHLHQFSPYYQQHRGPYQASAYLHHLAATPMSQHRPLALPAAATSGGGDEEDMSNPSSSGGGGGGSTRKRFRTKFSQEQKDKMLAFAEQVGWRIQKHDEASVEQFCAETCVNRNILKVWIHNNKNTLRKKP